MRWLWLCLSLLCFVSHSVRAQQERAFAPRCVIVLVPGLRDDDLIRPELPTLHQFVQEGAGGWMLCRSGLPLSKSARPDPEWMTASLLLTLGSGARAIASPLTTEFQPLILPKDRSVPIHPQRIVQNLQSLNRSLDHPVQIGALGSLLHEYQMRTAVLGNCDRDTPDRSAYLMAMDSEGRVDSPKEFMNGLVAERSLPYGLRASVSTLLRDYDQLTADTHLAVIAFGDLERADHYGPLCLPSLAAKHRADALHSLEALLAGLRSRSLQNPEQPAWNSPVRLFLLAPGPAESLASTTDRLAPLLIWGSGVHPGLLTSASTRRESLVVNTDLLPTLAETLHLPPPKGITGRPIVSKPISQSPNSTPTALSPARWQRSHERFARTARLQEALGGLPTVQMLLVLAGAIVLWRRGPVGLRAACSIAIVALPFGMLVLPQFHPVSVWVAGSLLAGLVLLCAACAWLLTRTRFGASGLFYGLSAALVLTLLLDLLIGSFLLHDAWMSYSVMIGARFYGIGNEYMGAVIGACCVLLAFPRTSASRKDAKTQQEEGREEAALEIDPIENRRSKIENLLAILLFITALLVMGAPSFGAKVGAVPSAGAALGMTALMRLRGRIRVWEFALILAGIVLLLSGFALLDLRHAAGEQSHLIRAFEGGGGDSLRGIISRKLLLEGYLLLHSPWSATMAVCALCLIWLRRSRLALFASDLSPLQKAVLTGLLSGAVACLLCNDSGVTAAAMILLYGWAWFTLPLPTNPLPPGHK